MTESGPGPGHLWTWSSAFVDLVQGICGEVRGSHKEPRGANVLIVICLHKRGCEKSRTLFYVIRYESTIYLHGAKTALSAEDQWPRIRQGRQGA